MLEDLFDGLGVPASEQRLVGCFAHPDDEAFTSGGSLARCAARGGQVQLVCATRGELGEIGDPSLATRETLGRVREGELREACHILGLAEPIVLGYRDSGMAGTDANDDPASFHRADPAAVVERLTELIRRHRPQVVLTFAPDGGYGHPDHIAIHRAAVAAMRAAADPASYPDQLAAGLEPHAPRRLVYNAIPRSLFRRMDELVRAAGIDPAQLSLPRRDDGGPIGTPDELIDIRADVSPFVDRKYAAVMAHRTQLPPSSPFRLIPPELGRAILAEESFLIGAGEGARPR